MELLTPNQMATVTKTMYSSEQSCRKATTRKPNKLKLVFDQTRQTSQQNERVASLCCSPCSAPFIFVSCKYSKGTLNGLCRRRKWKRMHPYKRLITYNIHKEGSLKIKLTVAFPLLPYMTWKSFLQRVKKPSFEFFVWLPRYPNGRYTTWLKLVRNLSTKSCVTSPTNIINANLTTKLTYIHSSNSS